MANRLRAWAARAASIGFDKYGNLGVGVFEKQDPGAFSTSQFKGAYALARIRRAVLSSTLATDSPWWCVCRGGAGHHSGELDANDNGNINKTGG